MAFPPESFGTGYLATAAVMNANLRDNVNTLNGGGLIPTGLIGVWTSSTATIPSGWGLCDGGGGRLDLRDMFPIAAGGAYAVGDTGGATSVTPAAHTAHVVTQPAHITHVVTENSHSTQNSRTPAGAGPFVNVGNGADAGHADAALSGGHTHSGADLDSAGTVHGHGAGVSLLPPYRAQAYMQKASSGLSLTTPHTWTTAEVPTAAQFNTELRDNINYLASYVLTLGTIAIWGFYAPSIPSGWGLCDGTLGTPDLRSKFVVGAGSSYAVGATGGALTARLPAHTTHTPTQPSDHGSHTVTQPHTHASLVYPGAEGAGGGVNPMDSLGHSGWGVNGHSSHANFGVNGHSAHTDMSILPPFYAAVYMQLLSLPAFTTPRTWTTGETVQAAEFNTYMRDNENAILAAQAPIGMCAIWSGSIASIPANWSLIAAFEDRFIPGAGTGTDGYYSPSATGGAASVTADPHADHSVTQPTSHGSHVVTQASDHVVGGVNSSAGADSIMTSITHSFSVATHDAHGLSSDPHSAHAAITTLPPYKAVAFMERLS